MPARPLARAAIVEVSRVARVTPNTARVTFTGPGVKGLPQRGYDHWFRFFLPRRDQVEPLLPPTEDWWTEVRAMPEDVRPVVRNYTIRRHRADSEEIDVDFVLHGDTGPASSWAGRVRPGDRAGLLDQGVTFDPSASGGRPSLIAGDETALPAIAGIVGTMGDRDRALVYIEVPEASEEQPLHAPPGVEVRWVHRDTAPEGGLLSVIRAADLPEDLGQAWLAGESSLVTGVRRHLVNDRGVARQDISFSGYWRRGRSVDDAA
ncbi:siderophore-interacting protein [Actinorugispora endophytica]|uniref:NADPH-dependent ferric siderophore reductase n=1 Tax=Actinorugispora endophytica TaxID=1605990 RepID=A0A4R6UYX4_9ACTN|nr:siderophore-interacting protein [Actinorugispora endophytica]TDQ51526.1 NADPH-dependent ferric siderophore reductase [Actinorugispora endophytica]